MENNKRFYALRYEFEPHIDDKTTGLFLGDQEEHKYSEQYVEERIKENAKKYGQELLSFKVLRIEFFESDFEMGIFIGNADF